MSDNDDKKPASRLSGRPQPTGQGQSDQPAGHGLEDPLAELDRIVSQDLQWSSAGQNPAGTVTNDDLRKLEQELLRELRGAQEAEAPRSAPSGCA